jgi:hypothetical protein
MQEAFMSLLIGSLKSLLTRSIINPLKPWPRPVKPTNKLVPWLLQEMQQEFKSENRLIGALALAVFLFGVAAEAGAALSSKDLTTTGDGQLTYDSDTGLSWLDLTATVGQSYNQILAGYGGFTTVLGFRYATADEVGRLFSNAGVTQTNWVWGYWNFNNPGYLANSSLVSLLGITYPFDGLSTYGFGLTGSNTLGAQGYHDYAIVGYNNHADYVALQAIGTINDSTKSPNVGSFLVKDITVNPEHKFRWVSTGNFSDCSANDRRGLTEGVVPVPSECKDTTVGLAAICWDQITYHGAAASPVCTYKSLTPEACVGGASPGVVYQCQSVQATDQTNLIDFTYGTGAGSFELGGFVAIGTGFNSYMAISPGDRTTITGWTVTGPGDGVDWVSTPGYGADTGIHSVDLQHVSNSSISTVIPTVIGNVYRLSFSAAANFAYSSKTGVVSAGSLVNQEFSVPLSGDLATQTFTPFTFLFTATASTTDIRFTATGQKSAYGPVIDSVSVVSASDYFGGTLKAPANYEFTLEKNTPKTEAIQLINPGTVARSATLEVITPHSGLTVSVSTPTPVSVAPGETKSLPLDIDPDSLPIGGYDGLLLKIVVDDGTTLYSNIKINIVSNGTANLPDLTLKASDIGFASSVSGDPVTLSAVIHNQGNTLATNVRVRFFEFGNLLGEYVMPEVPANGNSITTISVPMESSGDHLVRVVIDPDEAIPEIDETNNEASQIIQPGGATVETSGNILVSGSLPTTAYSNSLFTLSGKAVYDVLVNGVRNTEYVVKGGSVQITVTGENGAEWTYGGIHTGTHGNFVKSLQAPPNPGTYQIAMTVTDKTFIGKRELVFKVTEPPPPGSPEPTPPVPPITSGVGYWAFVGGGSGGSGGAWTWTWTTPPSEAVPQTDLRVFSENIHFSKNHPAKDEEVTIFAQINYWATNTDLFAENIPVNIYVTYPGNTSLKIGETLINQMSVGRPDFGSRYVYATWRNREDGIYLVEVEIDPSFVEENQLNNAATRAIIVGQLQAMQGAIAGQVTDAWGNGIGNVIIDVNEAGGTPFANTATDQAGFYLVDNVPLGVMSVHIETPTGYQADAETKAIDVADSAVSTVNFILARQAAPIDNTPPVLNLPTDIIAEATNPAGAIVTYSATATDAVDGAITPTCTPASGGMFALGLTNVSCSASDQAGNTANGGFNVTVRDTTPPTLICPAGVSVVQGQQINLGAPTVSDTVDTAPTLSNNSPVNFAVGSTGVIWTATDVAGNQANCTQQVTVSHAPVNQPPVADAGSDRTVRQGSMVTLMGSGSDPDKGPSALTFAWSQTGGGNVTLNGAGTARPTFTPSSNGSYTFRLVVNDGADDSALDTVQITVPLLCDIDLDGDVDRNDGSLITAARNRPASPSDLRDYDGNGTITVNDARACVLKCTRPVCATQ